MEEFNAFFVQGFFNLVGAAASARRPEGIVVFYPSSEFVVDRPADMTEYAMSKAAAEVLCEDMSKYLPGVRILMRRLPRLLTDQTAALDPEEVNDPLPVMLPVVRDMHKRTEPKSEPAPRVAPEAPLPALAMVYTLRFGTELRCAG